MFSFLNVFSSLPNSQEREKPVIHSLEIVSNIRYRYAHTVIASKVYNSNDAAQELAFNTTLPETAFVSSFSLEVDGKVYNAYVKEKEEAKKVYMEAVEHGRTAGHVCIRDSNQFSVSVNIAPKKEVTFLLKYEELLNRKLGRYKHVINLNPGQIVPQFRVVINIQESTDITMIKVPELKNSDEDQIALLEETTNTIAIVERPDPHSAVVKFEPTQEQQCAIANDGVKGQFIVLYDVDRTFQPTQLLVNDGYFVHFFAPEELKPLSKHVVFVLDISSSMYGRKVEQLKEAMEKILTDLHSQDYFSLIAFNSNTTVWRLIGNGRWDKATIMECDWKKLVIPATSDNVLKAKEAIQMLQASGVTNTYEAMMIASHITKLRSKIPLVKSENETATGQPESTVIFLTDGRPTVGNCNEEEIVNETTRWNQTSKATIFTLGLGTDVNFDFLKKLALHNSGFSRKIYEASDTALQLMDFYKEVSSPLVSNIMFTYLPDQVDADSLTQHNFPTFYLGNELIVCGRLEDELPEEDMGFEIIGRTSDGERHFHPQNMNIRFLHETGFMERMWAYLTIQQLLKDTKCLEKNLADEKKQQAIQLALKFSFVTPVTSLVVVQPEGKEQGQEASLTELGMMSSPLQVQHCGSYQQQFNNSLHTGLFGSTAFAGYPRGYTRSPIALRRSTLSKNSTASTGNSMAFAVNPTASTGNSMAFAGNSTASTGNAMTFAEYSTGFTGNLKGFAMRSFMGGSLTDGTLSSDNMATEDSDVEYFIDGIISNGNLLDEMVNTERGKKYLGTQELLKGNVYKRISDKAYKTDNEIRKVFSDSNICIKFDQIFLENHYLLCVNGYCILSGEVKVKTLGCIVCKDCGCIDSKNCAFELPSIISGLPNVFLAVINSHTKNNCVIEQSQNNAKLIEKEKCIMQTLFYNDIPGLKCIAETLLLAIPDFFRGIENTFISIKSVLSKLNVPNPETEMFDSASSLLYLIDNLNNIDYSEKFIRELNISPNEFDKLAEIAKALICMKPALVNLQNEQLIFNTLYGSWTECITKISQLGSECGKALGACMEEKLAEVLEDPIYLAALFLDPKYKMVLSEDERRMAKEELHRLGHIFSEKSASLVRNTHIFSEKSASLVRNTSGIIEKLKEYEKVSELNKDTEVLDYWESQKEKQPELYKLATTILSVPVSEASVYRMISNKKLLLSSMPRQVISNIMKIK